MYWRATVLSWSVRAEYTWRDSSCYLTPGRFPAFEMSATWKMTLQLDEPKKKYLPNIPNREGFQKCTATEQILHHKWTKLPPPRQDCRCGSNLLQNDTTQAEKIHILHNKWCVRTNGANTEFANFAVEGWILHFHACVMKSIFLKNLENIKHLAEKLYSL